MFGSLFYTPNTPYNSYLFFYFYFHEPTFHSTAVDKFMTIGGAPVGHPCVYISIYMYADAGTAHRSWETSTNDPTAGSPPSIADLYSGARSRTRRVWLPSVSSMQILRHVGLGARRAGLPLSLSLSLRMLFFFSFFFRKVFNLWNLIFLFFWLCVTFWKSFVLYFSGFFIGSRSVGHREIWRPIRIFFCGFCIEKKSPSSLGDTEGGIILTAEKEKKRVPSWDSVGSPCPSTLVNSPLVYCLEPTSTHTCVCVIRTSLSHWMVIVKLCKTFFWKVKGRLFSLSSLVGFSTVF
jgi:hypothetical protein